MTFKIIYNIYKLSQLKNTWYCATCNFYVFDTKQECKKCLQKKPEKNKNTISDVYYDKEFDEEMNNFHKQQKLESKTFCSRCRREGRIFNKEPMKSVHNCWKYS